MPPADQHHPPRTSAPLVAIGLLVSACGNPGVRVVAPPRAVAPIVPAAPHASPVTPAPRLPIRALSGSNSHACALFASGRVGCWGVNERGALGDGTTVEPASPLHAVMVEGLDDVAEVAVGNDFSCARKADGTVWCWGDNEQGQLGNGTVLRSPRPMRVPGVTGVTDLEVYLSEVAVARGSNPAMVWGHGRMTPAFGGDASTDRNLTPLTTTLRSGSRVAWVSSVGLCTSGETGAPRCIGTTHYRGTSLPIALPDPIGDRFSCGEEHCCYLLGGEARCVGPTPIDRTDTRLFRAADHLPQHRGLWEPVGNGPARDVRTTWRGTQFIGPDGVYRCFGDCPPIVLSRSRAYRQVTEGAILADDHTVWAWGPLIQGIDRPHPILRFSSPSNGEPQPVIFPPESTAPPDTTAPRGGFQPQGAGVAPPRTRCERTVFSSASPRREPAWASAISPWRERGRSGHGRWIGSCVTERHASQRGDNSGGRAGSLRLALRGRPRGG
jgi:hypothetical protein